MERAGGSVRPPTESLTRRSLLRRAAGLGAAAMTPWLLAACGGTAAPASTTSGTPSQTASTGTVQLRLGTSNFKASGGIDPATGLPYKGLNDLFAASWDAKKTGISVRATDIVGSSVNDTHAKIVTLLLGGQIDMLLGATVWPYFQQKLLVDLTPYYKKDNWRANFIQTIFTPPIERIMYPPYAADPTTYVSVPADLSVISTAYDQQLFSDFGVPPLSDPPGMDEIVSKLPKLTGKNPRTGQQCYGMYYNAKVASHQILYFLGHGNIDFGSIDPTDPAKIAFDTPLIKSAIQEMIALAKYCPPGFVLGEGAQAWGTTSNNVAINMSVTPQGGGSAGMLTAVQNKLTDRFVVTGGIRDKDNHTFYVSADEYAIAAKSPHPDQAWAVLKFLSGPVAQKFYFENFQALPSWQDQNWMTPATYPYATPFLAEANAAHEAFFPEFMFSTYRPWLNSVLSDAIAGKGYNLDTGLAQMQQQAERWVTANYTVSHGQIVPK